jgi:hypothetical protein
MSGQRKPNAFVFPPYGHMVEEWETLTVPPRTPPAAWRGGVLYERWRTDIVELLSHVLWPKFDPVEQKWCGPAETMMLELTLADFELFKSLRGIIWRDAGLPGQQINHYHLFQIEDQEDAVDEQGVVRLKRSLETTLRKYLAGILDNALTDDIANGYLLGLGSKSGNVDLDTKIDMQRPRAYQMSFILGITGFTHQHATSAVTPSMISGHCVESMMGGLTAFFRGRELGYSNAVMDAIAQHTVDVGDRRVFAGVHYPSDNISSWLSGLLLCPHVCVSGGGAEWLWDAISNRSSVYRAITGALAQRGEQSPYAEAMALLRRVGEREITDVGAALDYVRRHRFHEAAE